MIIVSILMLWVIGLSIGLSLYSSFLPYFSLLRDIKEYNMAYYGANTAIERSLLVLRQHGPWFESDGWWNLDGDEDVSSDITKDIPNFNRNGNYISWTIRSRTDNGHIPWVWQGNTDDPEYNMLAYGQTQTIPLWIDNADPSDAYDKDETSRERYEGSDIKIAFQLPRTIVESFHNQGVEDEDTDLCDDPYNELCDGDGDGVANDIVVGRRMDGMFDENPFSILPRNVVGRYDSWDILASVHPNDSAIRETDVNAMSSSDNMITFWSSYNPLDTLMTTMPERDSTTEGHLMIGSQILFDDPLALNTIVFSDFSTYIPDLHDLALKFTLQQKLITNNGQIYPFLRYRVESDPAYPIAQPFFFVKGEAKVWDYVVKMTVTKPIDKQNSISSFAVIF